MKILVYTLLMILPAFGEHHTDGHLPAGLPAKLQPAALEQAGFTSLFNGKDLSGWNKVGGTGEFEVKDGEIRGFGKQIKGNTFLRTDEEFGDFIYAFQFKFIDKNGNSGCMFRGLQKGGALEGRVTGYQCEHDNFKSGKRAYTAGIYDEARRGWLFPHAKAPKQEQQEFTDQGNRIFKWDDWNTIVIRCKGNHLETWLNGEKRADYTDTDQQHTTLKGFFALQVHGGASGDIRWKNLYYKAL